MRTIVPTETETPNMIRDIHDSLLTTTVEFVLTNNWNGQTDFLYYPRYWYHCDLWYSKKQQRHGEKDIVDHRGSVSASARPDIVLFCWQAVARRCQPLLNSFLQTILLREIFYFRGDISNPWIKKISNNCSACRSSLQRWVISLTSTICFYSV